ncbi:hypothetical protein ES705_27641 [subsurface metagenome]
MTPGLPKLPRMNLPANPLEPLREIVREGCERIEKAGGDIRSVADEIHSGIPKITPATRDTEMAPQFEPQGRTARSKVTTEETIAYQKKEIGKEILLLEKHLVQGCRIPPITGKPCDCCSPKHTVTIEALALETYGITGAPIYQELAEWAKEIEGKTTVPEIESGQHNYGNDAVRAREYRKRILGSESLEALLSSPERDQVAESATNG